MGNVRVSYVKNSAGVLEVKDTNDYYPFGMSFLLPSARTVYDPMAIPYNYKFGGKELQETGQYDFGARMYMPDIGRWGVVDPLAETTRRWTPYNYALDNPIMFVDPDGRKAYDHPELGFNNMPSENSFANLRGNDGPRNHSAGGEGGGANIAGNLNGGGYTTTTSGIYSNYGGQGALFTGNFATSMFNYLLQNISATGILNIKGFHFVMESKTPNIYRHTLNAFLHAKPKILHYDADKSRQSKRRNGPDGAVTTYLKNGGERESGMSLDEYPYASTFEGGGDALVINVPRREQSIQGAQLGGFGGLYRTLNSGDAFMVLPVSNDREPEDVKQEVMQRYQQPIPSPIGRPLDFANPAVPRNLWPALGVVAVGAFMYHLGWRMAL